VLLCGGLRRCSSSSPSPHLHPNHRFFSSLWTASPRTEKPCSGPLIEWPRAAHTRPLPVDRLPSSFCSTAGTLWATLENQRAIPIGAPVTLDWKGQGKPSPRPLITTSCFGRFSFTLPLTTPMLCENSKGKMVFPTPQGHMVTQRGPDANSSQATYDTE
jgi:hypothetical protein